MFQFFEIIPVLRAWKGIYDAPGTEPSGQELITWKCDLQAAKQMAKDANAAAEISRPLQGPPSIFIPHSTTMKRVVAISPVSTRQQVENSKSLE